MLTLIYDDGGDDVSGLVREVVNYDDCLVPDFSGAALPTYHQTKTAKTAELLFYLAFVWKRGYMRYTYNLNCICEF